MTIEKVKFEYWFAELVTAKTEELRLKLENTGKPVEVSAVEQFFTMADVKLSDDRLTILKDFVKKVGGTIDSVEKKNLFTKIESVRFSLMGIKNGTGMYGKNFFLVTRTTLGYTQEGVAGDCFPDSNTATWVVPKKEVVPELIEKFISVSYKDNDFRDMINGWKPSIDMFVDFTSFDARGVVP